MWMTKPRLNTQPTVSYSQSNVTVCFIPAVPVTAAAFASGPQHTTASVVKTLMSEVGDLKNGSSGQFISYAND